MILRIRFGKGAKVEKGVRKNRRLASVAAALLNPAALIAAALALWRVTNDLNVTRNFAINSGFFSHWQAWLAAAALLQLCSRLLNRYSRNEKLIAANREEMSRSAQSVPSGAGALPHEALPQGQRGRGSDSLF